MMLQETGQSTAEKTLDNAREIGHWAYDFVLERGPSVVGALVTLFVGWMLARFLTRTLRGVLERGRVDPMLASFLSKLSYFALLAFVVVSSASMVGVQTASFVAVIGAAGLAVGFALQGSLSNFASGVMLLVFRPFRVGDFVEAAGTQGTVDEVGIFATTLKSPDNKRVIVSNSAVYGSTITNYSAHPTRRLDLVVGIAYGDDIRKAKDVLQRLVDAEQRILKEPASMVAVKELGDSSVNLLVRFWANTPDYWDVHFAMTEAIKLALDEAGISIPFPQRDVHLHQVA